jgi:predicted Rossmann fold flavoprotein
MLKGLRVRGEIAIERDGRILRRAEGEILFAEDGLSGIAAMEVSREARAGTLAALDLLPEYSFGELCARLRAWQIACPEAAPAQLLAGLLPKRVGEAVLAACGGASMERIMERIVETCKRFAFPVTGTRGFAHAQVTAGGADVREFDPLTLESRLAPGLYACGEALDVDGGCGGFNLHWAWASGVLAGHMCSNM